MSHHQISGSGSVKLTHYQISAFVDKDLRVH
jgi:hypothetical protein